MAKAKASKKPTKKERTNALLDQISGALEGAITDFNGRDAMIINLDKIFTARQSLNALRELI